MTLSHETIHELAGHSARLTAILNLIRNPETRGSLDQEKVDHDVRLTLRNFQEAWIRAMELQQKEEAR